MKTALYLNHVFRLIWSETFYRWIAVAEQTCVLGKNAIRQLIGLASFIAVLVLPLGSFHAAPLDGQVTSRAGVIVQSSSTTSIKQTSQNLMLTWKSFNVGASERVNFVLPLAVAIAVNRMTDINASQILRNLNANGQVYLINTNGIIYGQGAPVNVAGLVAFTLSLSDESLNNLSRTFAGNGRDAVVSKSVINAVNEGYVAFIREHVSSQDLIAEQRGTVALGAGSTTTLKFSGPSLVSTALDQSLLNELIDA